MSMFKGSIFQMKKSSIWLVYPQEFKAKVSPQLEAISPSYGGTFHQNIKLFLSIGQYFALLPINGISGSTSASLGFSFMTLRMLYTLLLMTASSAMAVITLCHIITSTHFKLDNFLFLPWYIINILIMGEYIRIGRKWPTLMKHWEAVELNTTVRDINTHALFRKLILFASICVPVLASIEHLLSLANKLNAVQSCNIPEDLISAYFSYSYPSYYEFFRINYVSGIGLMLLNLFCTVSWNFTDNFIIIVSLGLITQFRHFNVQFDRYKGMHRPDDFWGRQRTYYNKLMNLIDHVNRDFAVIIIISYLNNLFYICLQLFNSVTPSNSIIRSVYFWFSLIYLMGRTIAVSIIAAFINDEAKKPIKILHSIPTSVYRSESKRFMEQLSGNTIALSGMQFFYITRKFILSIAGTIITYEVVLIQLKHDPETNSNPCEG